MRQETKYSIKKGVTNTFGSFGYLFCFLQWFWSIILYISVLQSFSSFVAPHIDKPVEQPTSATFTLPDPLAAVIIGAIVIIMIIVTIYTLYSVPRTIVKTSSKMVHKTAESVAPLVIKTQHKQDTKKRRLTLTPKLVLIVKLLLIIIPFVLTAASGLLDKQAIDYLVAFTLGCALACFSIVAFAVQYILAKLLRLKPSEVW